MRLTDPTPTTADSAASSHYAASRLPWHEALRALREARGATQDGWAARLGVSRRTIQRWERGERAPDPGAETALLAYCRQVGLFRAFDRGPLAGMTLTEEGLRNLFAEARWRAGGQAGGQEAAAQPSTAAPEGGSGTPPTNLPVQLTSFVGREQELAAVRRVQAGTRLLTLTGPGGGGKTRLALALTDELLWAYPHGIWFVDLAPLADPALVPQVVASALGLRPAGQQPLAETLTEALKARHLLLVLDNCEHLLPTCAELVETLLRACPHLEVVATSRESLGAVGETVWRVPPMALPDTDFGFAIARSGGPLDFGLAEPRPMEQPTPDGAPSQSKIQNLKSKLEVLLASDAVRLFVERARLQRPEFALTPDNVASVAEICGRLDGMPLAIELAAARVSLLSPGQIAARLHDRFQLLTGGGRTALPRHQTLRAAMDWSYDLLAAPEQALLRALSVFAGGFTLEAAEAVCSQMAVLDLLAHLVDKSLVSADEQGGVVRYRLLETVRHYAAEHLDGAGEALAVHQRHAAWCLALVEAAAIVGPQEMGWLVRLEQEHDNLRAALRWALERGEPPTSLRLSGALWRFWLIRGYLSEGQRWLERALALADAASPAPAARAKALNGAGNLAQARGDYARAATLLESGLALWRNLGDSRGVAWTLHDLGKLARLRADYDGSQALLEQARPRFEDLGDQAGMAWTLGELGLLARLHGDAAQARPLLEQSLQLRRALGDREGTGWTLGELGDLARMQGDHRRARTLLDEGLALFREIGSLIGVAWTLYMLGNLARQQGAFAQAEAHLDRSLALCRHTGHAATMGTTLDALGTLARMKGEYARARTLLEEALACCRAVGDRRHAAWTLEGLAMLAALRGDYDAAQASYEESLALFRDIGHSRGTGHVLSGLGALSFMQEEHLRARLLFEQALPLLRAVGDTKQTAWTLCRLGRAIRRAGDRGRARALMEESVTLLQAVGDQRAIAQTLLAGSGALAVQGGAFIESARLLGAAAAHHPFLRPSMYPDERAAYDASLAAARSALGEARFAAAWAAGQAMPLREAVAAALEVATAVDTATDAASAQGQQREPARA